ncbi:MAG TPA: putative maltokinase, partial [Thermodesulfobacteriota bacterium]|nr:putative maltokinase [Thermodesulfobacteriota bacterium]
YILLSLRNPAQSPAGGGKPSAIPEMQVSGRWESALTGRGRQRMETEVLPLFLAASRWFGGKTAIIRQAALREVVPFPKEDGVSFFALAEVAYTEGAPDLYGIPVSFAPAKKAEGKEEPRPEPSGHILAKLAAGAEAGFLYDAVDDPAFRAALLSFIARRRRAKGSRGELQALRGEMFRKILGDRALPLASHRVKGEQTNTSIVYEDRFYFKLFRNIKEGTNPEEEVLEFLTEKAGFRNIAPFAGSLKYQERGSEPVTLGILLAYVPSEGDAWSYTQDTLGRYFERALSQVKEIPEVPKGPRSLLEVDPADAPPMLREWMEGNYLEMTALLARRTAELHLALASSTDAGEFSPEPFSMLWQRSVFQSMRVLMGRVWGELRSSLPRLPESVRKEAESVLAMDQKILAVLQKITSRRLSGLRIRIHGDYHLGQVLFTGKDFIIIDFEGEPFRSITERRLKLSPVRDLAGMVRSYHYAAYTALRRAASVRPEDTAILEPWAKLWYRNVSGVFLRAYIDRVGKEPILPADREELQMMLNAMIMEKAIYETGYELSHRPDWLSTPLRGIRDLLEGA